MKKVLRSAKPSTGPSYPNQMKGGKLHTAAVDHQLMGVNPLKRQFEPTPEEPVRQHYKMAGGCD